MTDTPQDAGHDGGAPTQEPPTEPSDAPFFDRRDQSPDGHYRRAIFSVPVDVVVSVGQAQPVIGELLAMRRDMVLPLSSRVDDPVQIMVGDRVIARGELEELSEEGGRLGVRLTEVVDVSDLF